MPTPSDSQPTTAPTRELAAIMFSDIAGYTAIMGHDEQQALRALDAHRGMLRTLLPKYNGRLIGEIGDGTLSSFHSAIDAVNCAREVQARAEDNPEFRLRIGIHLGDVLLTNNTVLGDGVNVASRIHALAPPCGICISEHVYDEVRNKPGMHAKDLGRKRLKNVSRPIRVYALQIAAADESGALPISPRAVAAIVLLATAIAIAYAYRAQIQTVLRERTPAAEPTKATVAVLPFANLSANKDDEYFSDGMTDEIAGDLSKIPGMQVAARTSSFAFKGRNEDASKIAGLLHVRNLLQGSVQRVAENLRIEVQLIDASSGFTLWSQRYDEKTADVFQIQSMVAENVAQSLRVRLMPSMKERLDRRPTENLAAYDLYLRGRYYLSQFSEDGWTKAVDAFNGAIAEDRNFALAYVGLGAAYGLVSDFTMAPREAIPKANSAISRALALDDSLGEAHGTLAAFILYGYDWNWPAAEREFKRALELEPSSALVRSEYSEFLKNMGRFDDALEQARRAYELDPLSVPSLLGIGWVYRDSRNDQRALEYFQRAIEMAPESPFGYMGRGMVHDLQGKFPDAVLDFEKAAGLGRSPIMEGWLAIGYGQTGRRSDALNILGELKEQSRNRFVDPTHFAVAYFAVGDKDQAFRWMERAHEERSYFMTTLKLPIWDIIDPTIRRDPRFQAIYTKVGLPP